MAKDRNSDNTSNRFDFLRLAKERKTTYEFSEKKIKEKDIQKILEAGRWAPSCTNLQHWKFIVIKDQKVIDKITNLCHFIAFHTNSPLIIALVLDPCKSKEHICSRGKIDDYIGIGQPALNMIYQATVLGIGSCYLSPKKGSTEKILGTPKDMEVAITIGFGYEKKGAFQKKRERRPLSELVFHERYGRK